MDRVEFDYWRPRDVARLLSLVEAERRYFQEMMAVLPVGVALVSPSLELTMTNRAFRRLMGLERENAADRRLDVLLDMPSLRDRAREVLETRSPHSILSHDTETAKGKRTLLLSLQPFRDWSEEGAPEILLTLEDVSDMVTTQLPPAPPREIAEAPAPEPTPAMAAASAMIRAKLTTPPEPEREPAVAPAPVAEAAPAPQPLSPLLENAAHWRLDVASMNFESVDVPAGLAEAGLPKDAWSEGVDFWSGRVVSAHLPLVKSFYEQAIAGMPLHSVEYRAVTAAANRTLWLRDVIRPVLDESGRITHLEGATCEVTHLRQREDSIAQSLKVDALTRLAGRVAHECNNLLTILGGHGEELLHSLSPDIPARPSHRKAPRQGRCARIRTGWRRRRRRPSRQDRHRAHRRERQQRRPRNGEQRRRASGRRHGARPGPRTASPNRTGDPSRPPRRWSTPAAP